MPPKNKGKSAAQGKKGAVITITDGSKRYVLRSSELGPGDDLVSRQQTGYPVGHFLETFSSDSMVVVIWMARRKSGEPNLSFQAVLADYPTYDDFEGLEADFEEVSAKEEEAEDPLDDEPS